MKKFFMTLAALVFSNAVMASEHPPQTVAITLQKNFTIQNDSGLGDYFYSIRDFGGKKGCSLHISAKSPVTLKKGLVARGIFSAKEKEVWNDADDLTKSATTQFNFTADDQSFTAGVACFSSGFVFPTAGLPSLKKLLQMSRGYMTFK